MLAALMAILDMVLNRIGPLALHVLGDERAIVLLRIGPFPRNIAAVAGTLSLAIVLFGFLRMAGWSGLLRRLQIAGLSGLLFPSLLIGLFLPKDRMPASVVLIAVGVGHALVALLGVVVIRYGKSATRWASLAAMVTSALVLTLLISSNLEAVQHYLSTGDTWMAKLTWTVMMGSRLGGELVWCAVPWIALLPRARALVSERRPMVVLAVSVTLALVLAVMAELILHPNYGIVAYSAFRLTFLGESLAGLYGLFALLAVALATAACASKDAVMRQLGAATVLWIACGFAPRSLAQVLYFVLAAALLSRVTQATDPEGQRRALLPWGAPRTPPLVPADLADEG